LITVTILGEEYKPCSSSLCSLGSCMVCTLRPVLLGPTSTCLLYR
jgi:hypothetical protein